MRLVIFLAIAGAVWGQAPGCAGALVTSALYQADRGQPVMREYGQLPAPVRAARAVVAFRDGRVEPVLAYWVEGAELVYISATETVRRVEVGAVDVGRSRRLNRVSGVPFKLR